MANPRPYLHRFDAEWERIESRATGWVRRLGERLRISAPVNVRNGREQLSAELRDLSCTGCALLTQAPGRIGDAAGLTLVLNGRRLVMTARCVRQLRGGAAYEFTRLSDCDRLTLAEHLDRYCLCPVKINVG